MKGNDKMAKFKADNFKSITLDMMCDYIEENAPEDKEWFKKVCYQTKDGKKTEKYNHLNATREFCKKYAPELIPVAKEKKEPVSKRLENW